MRNKNNRQNGYTIIETMIAVSVFLVVAMYGMDSLLSANLLHQKSADMRSIMDNLSFIMEDMSRNLRTGSNYHCSFGPDTPQASGGTALSSPSGGNCWGVAFEPSDGDPATLADQWFYNVSLDNKLWKTTRLESLSDYVQLTPEEVSINSVSGFTVLGAEPSTTGDTQEPLVTIRLVGTITFKNVVTPFSLQTSVSQRLIDI